VREGKTRRSLGRPREREKALLGRESKYPKNFITGFKKLGGLGQTERGGTQGGTNIEPWEPAGIPTI